MFYDGAVCTIRNPATFRDSRLNIILKPIVVELAKRTSCPSSRRRSAGKNIQVIMVLVPEKRTFWRSFVPGNNAPAFLNESAPKVIEIEVRRIVNDEVLFSGKVGGFTSRLRY